MSRLPAASVEASGDVQAVRLLIACVAGAVFGLTFVRLPGSKRPETPEFERFEAEQRLGIRIVSLVILAIGLFIASAG